MMSSFQSADLDSIELKRSRLDSYDIDTTSIINRCIECGFDLGENSSRQLCAKTYCMFDIQVGQNDIRPQTRSGDFLSDTEFDIAWHNRESYRWVHLPILKIFRVIRIDSNKNLYIKDKEWYEYIIPFQFIPLKIFLDIQNELGEDLTKCVYIRKGLSDVYQIVCI